MRLNWLQLKVSHLPGPVSWLVALLAVLAGLVSARAALGVTNGLQAEYFANDQRTGPPAIRVVSPAISTAHIVKDWRGPPPAVFSARWFGYLNVGGPGEYTFSLSSDDGATLWIDGEILIDNGGIHGLETRTGSVTLSRGPHLILLEYVQVGGLYELELGWAQAGRPVTAIPTWVFSTRRVHYRTALLARSLDAFSVLVLIACGVLGSWMLVTQVRAPATRLISAYPRVATLALFVALAILHTWPLASDPAHLSRNDNGDTILNEWILAWVAHQAIRAPLDLFNANIFFPERNTLAYSESMIVQSAMGAPFLWLGASPVLTYNLVLMAGFTLTGWTMSLVVTRWTADRAAGITSGILAAFNAHNLTRIPHLQAQHMEFFPLALFSLDALLREPRARHALRLAGWFTLQALTSFHLLVFSSFAMVASAVVRPEAWQGSRLRKLAPQVALAVAVSVLALLPFLLPYGEVYRVQGFSRPLADADRLAASWRDYLGTPARLHFWLWSRYWYTGVALFPGVMGLALTGLAFADGTAFRDRRARMCLAFGVCGLVLSFGTAVPGYAFLYEVVPLLWAVRAVSRFAVLAFLGIAVLAGFGLASLRPRLSQRVRFPLSLAVVAVVALEPLAAPLGLSRYEGIPAIYDRLRSESGAVVVEMPFPHPRASFANAPYMLNSTRHWKPMLNGYSGLLPASYLQHYEGLKSFPSVESLTTMRNAAVTHVVVHLDDYAANVAGELEAFPGLRKLADDGSIALYRLDPEAEESTESLESTARASRANR